MENCCNNDYPSNYIFYKKVYNMKGKTREKFRSGKGKKIYSIREI